MYIWIIIAAAVTVLDQVSKALAAANISPSGGICIIPGIIDMVYVENTGAAFSILNKHTWLLGLVSAMFCIGLAAYMIKKKQKNPLFACCGGLLLGGALGNGIDRVLRGYVIDFFEFSFFKFPVFNVADIAITVGAALLVIYVLINDKENKDEEDNAPC